MKHLRKFNENVDGSVVHNEYDELSNYMFFSNLESIKSKVEELLSMDESMVDGLLREHDWASDHISVANENIEHVHSFLKNINK